MAGGCSGERSLPGPHESQKFVAFTPARRRIDPGAGSLGAIHDQRNLAGACATGPARPAKNPVGRLKSEIRAGGPGGSKGAAFRADPGIAALRMGPWAGRLCRSSSRRHPGVPGRRCGFRHLPQCSASPGPGVTPAVRRPTSVRRGRNFRPPSFRAGLRVEELGREAAVRDGARGQGTASGERAQIWRAFSIFLHPSMCCVRQRGRHGRLVMPCPRSLVGQRLRSVGPTLQGNSRRPSD